MAFIKKLWKDRISQFPNRRTINDGSVTKQVTVGRDEGTITEPGDSFDASNMNDLEQRIEDAYGDVVSLVASEVAVQYHGDVIFDNVPTTSHGVGYAVTSDGLKTALDSKADTSILAPVATSGDYDDLLNKPTIPAAQIQSDWSQADNTQVDYIKNKPTVPGNATELPISGNDPTDTKSYIDDLHTVKTIINGTNGIYLRKIGNMYRLDCIYSRVDYVYSAISSYATQGLQAGYLYITNVGMVFFRMQNGSLSLLSMNNWSALPTTDTSEINGSVTWYENL